ncbi:hypothetical protein [Microbacterium sp. P02]|uniref:hypothetical protein n=1 Tax=Microbacterium sp. P02 TaxID=3366260 RepID=UPI00366EDB44
MPAHIRHHVRALTLAAAGATLMLALVGCQPEPSPTNAASSTPSTSSSTAAPASPSPSASTSPTSTAAAEDIALPASCDQLYSGAMRATLDATIPPLGDPGVTMYSTQTVEALEVLDSGVPTIRCTWGVPSETGLSTNVSIIDGDQAAAIQSALQNSGFSCAPGAGGTLCTFEERSITQDDTETVRTETQFFRGNAWVTTVSLNAAVPGYTEDIVTSLWG